MALSDLAPASDAAEAPAASDAAPEVRCFGVRHHGPGCARSLQRALMHWRPDCVLVEGPPEADGLLPLVTHEGLVPPVALLVHAAEAPELASFHPFAGFSPEWQALQHGVRHGLPTRFIDLPQAVRLARQKAAADEAAQPPAAPDGEAPQADTPEPDTDAGAEARATPPEDGLPESADPLDALAHAAGFADGESWWNHLVEERGARGEDGLGLFDAIAEAMTELRAAWPQAFRGRTEAGRDEEALREAHMRQSIREARKAGHRRIAVVCGAWHVPALQAVVRDGADKAARALARDDAARLKGLPRIKVNATWVPWTHAHLSRASGYGAGVEAPGWYDFLWQWPATSPRAIGWLSRVARLLREHQIDCSSAHLIEAIRLSDTLAALRGRREPGLPEMDEAVRTTLFMGEEAPLRLIHRALTVGERLGRVPPEAPAVPLQRDLEQQQKSLRLKPEALQRVLELDLRQPNDLARSHLLHRLTLLDLPWGRLTAGRGNQGTFRETWALQWEPELSVRLIEASRHGVTVVAAATASVAERCHPEATLAELAACVDRVLLADLPAAVQTVSAALQDRAATTGDALQLMAAVPPLARVFRYGSVRQTDGALLAQVLDGLIARSAIGLPLACQGLDESAATALREPLLAAHEAIGLHARSKGSDEQQAMWHKALVQVAQGESPHALLRGLVTRLLLDDGVWDADDAGVQLSRQLSAGTPPLEAAHWLDGFLNRNAMVLLHDDTVWGLVDAWLDGLSDAHFQQVVPLVRRSFAAFSASERHDLGQRARRGRAGAGVAASPGARTELDPARAALPLPLLRQILGRPA